VKFRQVDLGSFGVPAESRTGTTLVYGKRLFIGSQFQQHDKLDAEVNVAASKRASEASQKKGKAGASRAGKEGGKP